MYTTLTMALLNDTHLLLSYFHYESAFKKYTHTHTHNYVSHSSTYTLKKQLRKPNLEIYN